MAGASDKKRIQQNAAHLQRLRLLIGGANVIGASAEHRTLCLDAAAAVA